MPDTSPPLQLRMRRDLVVSYETFGERRYAVIKDPLALRYYRFQEEEFAQLQLLDGRRGLEDIRVELENRFAPRQFPVEGIARFAAELHTAGLVTSDARGQAAPLQERRRKTRRRALLQKLMSPMSLQFRGIDPTRFMNFLYPTVRWCFTRSAMAAAACLCLAALTLVVVEYEGIMRRLPTFHQFFTPTNMLLLLAMTGLIKVVHELGHGLTCKHYGGECPELGVMLLVFAPCLYCNVSDAWRLPKSRRIAISAAGIIVELVIAATAILVWWFSQPGVLNQLCLGAAFVSGVSTILINGNPLMRYDGYFVLSDLVETPNLAEKSSAVVRRFFVTTLIDAEEEPDPLLPQSRRFWFALYAVASLAYRVVISVSIYLFLLEWLRPYDLEVVARGMGLMTLFGFTISPTIRLAKYLWGLRLRHWESKSRPAVAGAVIAVVLLLVALVPLPRRVWGTLELDLDGGQQVYVDVPGRLAEVAVRPGDRVVSGTKLATLENLDLDLAVAKLVGRHAELEAQLKSLRLERFQDTAAAARIPEVLESLAANRKTLEEKQAERGRLTLVASTAGVVFPASETAPPKQQVPAELPTWSGRPSDGKNHGASLTEGTLFCRIASGDRWQGIVMVDQSDVELLEPLQSVEIRFDQLPDSTLVGRVDEISRAELTESSKRLSNKGGGELSTTTGEDGVERPVSATYQVRVVLDDPERLLRIGLRGTARIHVAPASIGSRVARWLQGTFHFDI